MLKNSVPLGRGAGLVAAHRAKVAAQAKPAPKPQKPPVAAKPPPAVAYPKPVAQPEQQAQALPAATVSAVQNAAAQAQAQVAPVVQPAVVQSAQPTPIYAPAVVAPPEMPASLPVGPRPKPGRGVLRQGTDFTCTERACSYKNSRTQALYLTLQKAINAKHGARVVPEDGSLTPDILGITARILGRSNFTFMDIASRPEEFTAAIQAAVYVPPAQVKPLPVEGESGGSRLWLKVGFASLAAAGLGFLLFRKKGS
jgi:hypothetical protein